MPTTDSEVSKHSLEVVEQVRIDAPIEASFAALIEQMGSSNEGPNGTPLPMVLEAFPGGRWYRDLGNQQGHCWGMVQAIRHPNLLEISGPLFMSQPVINNVQYRLTTEGDTTLLTLRHTAFGLILDDYRTGLGQGWRALLDRVRTRIHTH